MTARHIGFFATHNPTVERTVLNAGSYPALQALAEHMADGYPYRLEIASLHRPYHVLSTEYGNGASGTDRTVAFRQYVAGCVCPSCCEYRGPGLPLPDRFAR